jgi:hypothetical protein
LCANTSVGDLVDQQRALELRSRHRITFDDDVQGRFDAHQARQALRAAGAGQQP